MIGTGMIILSLLFGLSIWMGVFFWVYWYMRVRMLALAKGKYYARPVALFLSGMGGFLVTLGMLYLSVFLLSTFPLAIGLVYGLGGLAGMVGWLIYLLRRFTQRKERAEFDAAHPLPRMQIWMQDIYAVVFYFAIYMSVIYGSGRAARRDPLEVSATVVYLLLAIVVSFYFSLDVCRRSLKLQRPLLRVLFIAGVALYTSLLMIVPAWLAWRAWRYALWQSGEVMGVDVIQAHRRDQLHVLGVQS